MRFPMRCAAVCVRMLAPALLVCGAGAFAQALPAGKLSPAASASVSQRFHEIYQELVEIDTTHSAGNTTTAARAMEKRLREAGFAASQMQVIEPFPRKGNLVARYPGAGQRAPMLLLAHLDVVEARREDWKTDPFKLQKSGGYYTARGSIDDKAMAAALVSVLDQLKREGFKPSRDIILALTADEERGAVPSNGIHWMLSHQPELLKAEFGINEGGDGELRAGKPILQQVQVAEKMYAVYELEARDVGGHSSMPTPNNPITTLATALTRLGAYQFPVKLADVTQTYFARSAPMATGQLADDLRAVGTGQPSPAAIDRLSAIPSYNAQLRTTCVATLAQAGHADNALPQSAKATINCRLLPHDAPADIERQLKQVIADDRIAVRTVEAPQASPASPLASDVMRAAESLTRQMWNVPVIPAMSTGATDSRFLRSAGIPVYGVSGLFVDPADYRAHGLDERVEITRLDESREFLYRLIKQLAE